tara:strand:+ start:437 stop:937 length:501 start_codon:yes stop_codon:yes gene_type:complete
MIEIAKPEKLVVEALDSLVSEMAKSVSPDNLKTLSFDEFLSRPVPRHDIPHSNGGGKMFTQFEKFIPTLEKCTSILDHVRCTNAVLMFENTQLPWHTNSNRPGTRTYYSTGGGAFKYIDADGVQQISLDNDNGWTVREFVLTKDDPFWHSTYSPSRRFSFGFGTDH